jgi:RNA polymerase sigma factor (sigma-70 family)
MDATPIAAAPARDRGVPARLALFGDERLARLVAGGSERAFATLYERYHQQLYRYGRSIVRDDADAEDVLQSTLASAFVALQRGQRDAPLRPWLFRIAHNEAISLVRRRRARAETTEAPEQHAPSAEERAGERARLAVLVADLQELPERQRGALLMRELSGLSHEEIAIALGTSVGVAKQAIFEARRALLEFAEGRSMRCEDVRSTVSDGDRRVLRGRRVRAHVNDCAPCAAFTAAIPARRDDLQALVPALAPASSAAILASITGGGSGHGAVGGVGAAAAGAAGKTVGGTLAAKALLGAAVLATAAAGAVGVRAVVARDSHATRPSSAHGHGATTAAGSARGGVIHASRARGAAADGGGLSSTQLGMVTKPGAGSSAPAAGGHATSTQAAPKGAAAAGARPVRAQGKPAGKPASGRSSASKGTAHRHVKASTSASGSTTRRRATTAGSRRGHASPSLPSGEGPGSAPLHVPPTPAPPVRLSQIPRTKHLPAGTS